MSRAFERPNAVIQPPRRHPRVVFLQELRRLLNDPYARIIGDRRASQRGRDEAQQVAIGLDPLLIAGQHDEVFPRGEPALARQPREHCALGGVLAPKQPTRRQMFAQHKVGHYEATRMYRQML